MWIICWCVQGYIGCIIHCHRCTEMYRVTLLNIRLTVAQLHGFIDFVCCITDPVSHRSIFRIYSEALVYLKTCILDLFNSPVPSILNSFFVCWANFFFFQKVGIFIWRETQVLPLLLRTPWKLDFNFLLRTQFWSGRH